jgi:hypothetical protein
MSFDLEVGRLVLLVVGVGEVDRGESVERDLAVRLRVGDRLVHLGVSSVFRQA